MCMRVCVFAGHDIHGLKLSLSLSLQSLMNKNSYTYWVACLNNVENDDDDERFDSLDTWNSSIQNFYLNNHKKLAVLFPND